MHKFLLRNWFSLLIGCSRFDSKSDPVSSYAFNFSSQSIEIRGLMSGVFGSVLFSISNDRFYFFPLSLHWQAE